MAYVDPNYPSKKAFKEAVGRGIKHRPYNPSGLFPQPQHGSEVIEGPHYPKPHRWYCGVTLVDGVVVEAEKVKLGSTPAPSPLSLGAVLQHKAGR